MKISIIVPAYNEEKTIISMLELVNQQKIEGVDFEVVVVDDGSKDRTRELLKSRAGLYSKLILRIKNGGKGAAIKDGLLAATGDYVLFQDADLEYDPADYAQMIVPLKKYNADLVMGSRTLAPQCRRVHYFWNRLGNIFITTVFNILFNKTFTDIYTCYLMYKRSLVDPHKLRTLGFDQHAEILSKCVRKGSIFYEVPISYHGRTHEEGKKIKAYHTFAVIWTIFRERLI